MLCLCRQWIREKEKEKFNMKMVDSIANSNEIKDYGKNWSFGNSTDNNKHWIQRNSLDSRPNEKKNHGKEKKTHTKMKREKKLAHRARAITYNQLCLSLFIHKQWWIRNNNRKLFTKKMRIRNFLMYLCCVDFGLAMHTGVVHCTPFFLFS